MDLKKTYSRGNELFAQCDYDNALKYYNKVLEHDSENETLLIRVSQCYQEMDLFDEALDILSKVLDLNLKSGNLNKAIAVCKRILTIDPDDTDVMLKLANILRHAGSFSDAVKYYRVVAKNYEYAGFLDKAIEILQTIQEIEKNSVEDILDLVKKESARGLKDKASRNINAIVYELRKGREYKLLDDALNLALTVNPDNIDYSVSLARLYFYTGRLSQCIKLCLWSLHLNKDSSDAYMLLIKSLLALGINEKAKWIAESVANGSLSLDDDESKVKARNIYDLIQSLDTVSKRNLDELVPGNVKDESADLSYLDLSSFTKVDHKLIQQKVLHEESLDKAKSAAQEKTVVFDMKKKGNLAPEVIEKIREVEILIAENLYDKASNILISLVEQNPGNDYIRSLFDKASKHAISDDMKSIPELEAGQYVSTDTLIDELEHELNEDSISVEYSSGDNDRFGESFDLFKAKLNSVVPGSDYLTNFSLGIAYLELELWEEAAGSFNKAVGYLMVNDKSNIKYFESQIYYALARSNTGKNHESIELLKNIIVEADDKEIKISALYHLGLCYEKERDLDDAKSAYKTILSYVTEYRDIDVRLKLIGG